MKQPGFYAALAFNQADPCQAFAAISALNIGPLRGLYCSEHTYTSGVRQLGQPALTLSRFILPTSYICVRYAQPPAPDIQEHIYRQLLAQFHKRQITAFHFGERQSGPAPSARAQHSPEFLDLRL